MSIDIRLNKLEMDSTYVPTSANNVANKGYVDGLISSLPSGAISAYGGTSSPSGWLLCDGTSYPGSVGSGFFNVPDLRGRFLRGVDGGTGRDPDVGSRTAMMTGGNSGNAVGSIQGDQFASHIHGLPGNPAGGTPGGGATGASGTPSAVTSGFTSSAAGGNESRPKNAYVNFIIKT
jgi:microcystin-dependent protein